MNDPGERAHSRPSRVLLKGCAAVTLLVVTLVVLAVTAFWSSMPPRLRAMFGLVPTVGANSVRVYASGRVVDAGGAPVDGAVVRGKWVARAGGTEFGESTFVAYADETGHYLATSHYSSGDLPDPEQVELTVTVQAFARFGETEPASEVVLRKSGDVEVELDFTLGPPLPTVPVHVVDAQGAPVTEFWVEALPLGESESAPEWPHRHKDFADGIAQLALPSALFRVRVRAFPSGVERTVVVGPYDPRRPPPRIDVVLPDK